MTAAKCCVFSFGPQGWEKPKWACVSTRGRGCPTCHRFLLPGTLLHSKLWVRGDPATRGCVCPMCEQHPAWTPTHSSGHPPSQVLAHKPTVYLFRTIFNKDAWIAGRLINNCSLVAEICVKWGEKKQTWKSPNKSLIVMCLPSCSTETSKCHPNWLLLIPCL